MAVSEGCVSDVGDDAVELLAGVQSVSSFDTDGLGRAAENSAERNELIWDEVRGCLTSTSCKTASSFIALDLMSIAMTAGASSGIRYIEGSHCLVFHGHPSLCISISDTRCFSINVFAASLFIPSLPATTHETLQTPQTSLSFPSLIQPHLDAATASMAAGLFA
jgi:hypothetical protein